ncbi:MAG TPA: hypothetical protein VIX37_04660, partial [Candidatus Sulfotelmatobacter sp.]
GQTQNYLLCKGRDRSTLRRTLLRRLHQSPLQHTCREPAPNQSQEASVFYPFGDLTHQFVVVDSIKGSHYTLPISSTYQRELQLLALGIRLKAYLSTFFDQPIGKVD